MFTKKRTLFLFLSLSKILYIDQQNLSFKQRAVDRQEKPTLTFAINIRKDKIINISPMVACCLQMAS